MKVVISDEMELREVMDYVRKSYEAALNKAQEE